MIGSHCWAAAGVLLLRELRPTRLLPNSIVELQHPLLELGVECSLLPPQIVNLDEGHNSALAFA